MAPGNHQVSVHLSIDTVFFSPFTRSIKCASLWVRRSGTTAIDNWHSGTTSNGEVAEAHDQALEGIEFLDHFVVLSALDQRNEHQSFDLVETATANAGNESRLVGQHDVLSTEASVVQEAHQTHEVDRRSTAVAEVQIGCDFLLYRQPISPESCFSDRMSVFKYR